MLGLVVTPTTLCSSTSDCRLPLRIRSRERAASHTAPPALDSCARFSFWAMSCPPLDLRGRAPVQGPAPVCEWCRTGSPYCSAVTGGGLQPADRGRGAGRGHRGGLRGLDALAGGGDAGLLRQPELLVELRVAGARAVVVEPDDPAGVTHEVTPAHRHAGLDADPGADARG